ncbi:uncharacterized protein LOC121732435 isoform X2 [Aricia agestis]|uniref:uncharacterized protein LOC121732435 isoform X1 n=1 Tax=Aricia agestis TaxID=91739 RepID=UPI001C2041D9|nr:uncharacterized protein LOC121732435 isoform X1 [Aricia agestis]XP_041978246.1 uncharacterized protein LOC121732435 isoform X2 [Aricia agestis]
METDKMSTASSVGAAERRPLMQALVLERRILFACTVLVGLSIFVWIAAVCTEKWVHIEGGNGILLPIRGGYFMWSDSGVWEICRYIFHPYPSMLRVNDNAPSTTHRPFDISGMQGQYFTNCTNYLSQPIMNKNGKPIDPAYDPDVANYVRTMISFGIISLFVMAMGCGFSVYTFRNPRYMFKRLAAGIHFISTSCTFVVVQVTFSTVDYMKKNLKYIYPERAYHYYHISFFLAWFVVLVNLFAAGSFLLYSRKRKGDKAATDELAMADEPTIIGR